MPQHKSAIKRVRQNERRRARNRWHRSRMRTMIKNLRATEEKEQAIERLNNVKAYLDRMATKGLIHKNKAANYKRKLETYVNSIG